MSFSSIFIWQPLLQCSWLSKRHHKDRNVRVILTLPSPQTLTPYPPPTLSRPRRTPDWPLPPFPGRLSHMDQFHHLGTSLPTFVHGPVSTSSPQGSQNNFFKVNKLFKLRWLLLCEALPAGPHGPQERIKNLQAAPAHLCSLSSHHLPLLHSASAMTPSPKHSKTILTSGSSHRLLS